MFRRDGCSWCAKWDREIGPIYPKTEFNRRAPLRQVNLDHDRDPSDRPRADPLHADLRAGRGRQGGRPDRGLSGRRVFLGAAGESAGAVAAACSRETGQAFRRLPAPARSRRSASDEGPRHGVVPPVRRAEDQASGGSRHRHDARQCAAGERIPQGALARGASAHPLLPHRGREVGERDREDAQAAAARGVAATGAAARRRSGRDAAERQEHLLFAGPHRGSRRDRVLHDAFCRPRKTR